MYDELGEVADALHAEALKAQSTVLETASSTDSLPKLKFLAGKAVGLDIAFQRVVALREKMIQDG